VTGVVGATPLLVYNRIDANRRKTRLLLIAFAIALLPALSGVGACFIVPSLDMRYGAAHPVEMASLQDQMRALRPAADGTYHLLDLPPALLWLYARFNLEATAIVTLPFVAITAFLIYLYGSRIVLRSAQARLVQPGHEKDLVQIVENLCIAAGLPCPRIHVIESAAPNAFATGRTPHDASLVVTRGLLRLLDRRELEGVIAHELSHIGNHDIGFSTTLAALVGTLSLPLRALAAPFRFAARGGAAGAGAMGLGVLAIFGLSPFVFMAFWISGILNDRQYLASVPYVWWWTIYVTIAPLYAVWVAPVVALLIRQAVSRQREFLADADAALLTRNPEGLALALVKIGAAGGEQLRVGEGTVHLYFVDPRSKGSWLHAVFPSHPSLERRVELLARMGSGIAPSAIQAAQDAGARVRAAAEEIAEATRTNDEEATEPTSPSHEASGGLSDSSDDGVPPHVLASPSTDAHALIPLYEQPDGWSRVLAQLPESAVVIPMATEGLFVRVITADDRTGYVSRSAPLAALKNLLTIGSK
jgi:heat shock protein HtpX